MKLESFCLISFINIVLIKLSFQQAPIVTTASGNVIGTIRYTVDNNIAYRSYRGIPYAKPPIGELRFEPPQPVDPWDDVLFAYQDGSPCVQGSPVQGSEDCLVINVYLPDSIGENEQCPVLVWIHGGSFITGNSSYESNGPDYFLEKGCLVFVSFNYRLGVFGFLSTEDMVVPGNNGLKDMILALKWVQINIDQFHGDPNKVTIFGLSAGAAAVTYLVQSPLAAGLFHQAIANSGSSLTSYSFVINPKTIATEIAASLLIDITSSSSMVNGLKQVDYKTLQEQAYLIQNALLLVDSINYFVFAPSIEPNHTGAVLSGYTHELLINHQHNIVPYLTGFTSNELGGYLASDAFLGLPLQAFLLPQLALIDADVSRLVPLDMNASPINSLIAGTSLKELYFGLLTLITASPRQFERYGGDSLLVKPILEGARIFSQVSNVYLYQFSYVGELGIPEGQQRSADSEGVAHGEDLNYFFRMSSSKVNVPAQDILTRQRLVTMWYNFATQGNPTPTPTSLLQNVTWNVMVSDPNDGNYHYLDIDSDLVMKENPRSEYIEEWYRLYNTYGNPPYITF